MQNGQFPPRSSRFRPSPLSRPWHLAAAALLLAQPGRAIVYRSDESDATAQGLANQPQFSGVGYVWNGANSELGTATAISPDWILTAKHVLTGYSTATFHAANGQAIAGTVYLDPDSDMALVHLNSSLNSGIAFITPNLPGATKVDPVGPLIWNVGYGNYGQYGQAVNNLDLKRRAGTNVVDSYNGANLVFSNQNTSGTEFESSTGPGDSGGPMFLQHGYQWLVVGEVFGTGTGGFVDTDVTYDNFITTTTGLSFAPAAAPAALKWNASYLSPSAAGSKSLSSLTDGGGVWDTTRLNFTEGTFTYAWQNGTLLPVTFGLGASGSGAAGTVTLGSNIAISDLTFNASSSGSYLIAGAGSYALTLNSTGSTVTANVNAAISAPMSGVGPLIKAGAGTLTLSGTSTFTGGTTVQAGTLALAPTGNLGAAAGALTMASGTTLNLGGASPTVGNFSGAGLVTNGGAAASTLTIGGGNGSGGVYAGAIQDGAAVTGLTKTGSGTLTLSGTNTYSGATTLLGGTLALGNAKALSAASAIIFNGASTLDLGNASASAAALTLGTTTTAGTYSVKNGSLTLTGASNFLLNPYGSTGTTLVDLSGAAAFTYTHAANSFSVGGPNSTGVGTTLQLATLNNITASTITVGGQTTTSTPPGTLHLGNSNFLNTGAIQLGGYRIGTTLLDFGSSTTNPAVTLRGTGGGVTPVGTVVAGQNNNGSAQTGTVNFGSGTTDAIITSLVVGAAATNGTTTGTFHMAGAGSTVNLGTLTLGYSFSTNGSGNITTGTFLHEAGTVLADTIVFGTHAGTLGSGTQAADNLQTSYTLGTSTTPGVLSARTLGIGTTSESAASRATLTFNNGTLTNYDPALGQIGSAGSSGGQTTAQDLILSGSTGGGAGNNNSTLTINLVDGPGVTHSFNAESGHSITVAATALINGNGALVKDGAGSLVLAGSAVHTGTTTVTAGALYVSGSINGTASLSVGNGATFGGSGAITTAGGGSVVMATGAKLSPGLAGAGQFSFTLGAGLLDLSGEIAGSDTGSLFFDLGTTSDSVKLFSGTLKLGASGLGLNDFSFTAGSGFGPRTYTLFSSSVPISGGLDASSLSGMVGGLPATLSLDASSENVLLTVVPEPSAGLLAAAGTLGWMASRRSRRARR